MFQQFSRIYRTKYFIRNGKFWMVLLLLGIGIILRGWQLGVVPPGLNQDEAASGYDSFSLLTEGIDRTGVHLPVFLPSWGSGMNAFAAYITTPSIALLGLSPFSIRFPFFLAAILSLFVFYIFLEQITDTKTAIVGLFLLAINPWHIMTSRWALESNLLPTLFLCAVVTLNAAIEKQKKGMFIAAGVLFGFCTYTYGTSYAALPVFLIPWITTLLWYKKIEWKHALIFGCSTLIVSVPIILFMLVNTFDWHSITTPIFTIPRLTTDPRFLSASTLRSEHLFTIIPDQLMQLFRLIGTENDGHLWNVLPPHGLFGSMGLLLAILGFVHVAPRCFKKTFEPRVVLLLWILACFFIAILTHVNINRINLLFLPSIALGAIGLRSLSQYPLIVGSIFLSIILGSASFTIDYFTNFPGRIKEDFVHSFHEAVNFASTTSQGNICITNSMHMAYIHVLFATKTNPHLFASTVSYENSKGEFRNVRSFGRFTFGMNNCHKDTNTYIVWRIDEPLPENVTMRHFSEYSFEQFSVFRRTLPPAPSPQ